MPIPAKTFISRPTTGRGPSFALAGSLLLHGAILALALLLAWQHRPDMSDAAPVVPVDLVTIAQKTNIAPMQVTTPPVKIPPPEAMPPPPVNLAAAPIAPDIKPPDIAIAPDAAKPAPAKPPTKKELQQDFSNLLDDLTKPQKGKHGAHSVQGAGAQSAMTADLADALMSQIYKCWNPPTGVPHAAELIVNIRLSLSPDGAVSQASQADPDSGDPYRKAALEAAQRAIHACGPYKLPTNRYSEWRQSIVVFDPRNLIGQ